MKDSNLDIRPLLESEIEQVSGGVCTMKKISCHVNSGTETCYYAEECKL